MRRPFQETRELMESTYNFRANVLRDFLKSYTNVNTVRLCLQLSVETCGKTEREESQCQQSARTREPSFSTSHTIESLSRSIWPISPVSVLCGLLRECPSAIPEANVAWIAFLISCGVAATPSMVHCYFCPPVSRVVRTSLKTRSQWTWGTWSHTLELKLSAWSPYAD